MSHGTARPCLSTDAARDNLAIRLASALRAAPSSRPASSGTPIASQQLEEVLPGARAAPSGAAALASWLNASDLGQYAQAFATHGYNDLDAIARMSSSQVDRMLDRTEGDERHEVFAFALASLRSERGDAHHASPAALLRCASSGIYMLQPAPLRVNIRFQSGCT